MRSRFEDLLYGNSNPKWNCATNRASRSCREARFLQKIRHDPGEEV